MSTRSPIVGNVFVAHRGFHQRGRFFGSRFFPGASGFGFFDLPFGWGGGWYPYCGDYGFYPYYDCPTDSTYSQQDPGENANQSQNSVAGDSFADSSSSRPMVVFVTKDGTTYGASDYWQQDGMVHLASTSGGEKTFPIADLDAKQTAEVNAARGVYFTLYPEAMASTGAELAASTYTAPACSGNDASTPPSTASLHSEVQFGVAGDETSRGLRVTSVTANSLAVQAGIQPGDVITRIGCSDVHSLAELNAATATNGGETIWVSYLIQSNWLSEKPVKLR